ncbi:ZIP family metal transporter [Raoultibacter phocaeensis]|uniref:ZIP family metal transporter n=1 Tax=Raoultibacter phocaeensis TaxID=2479841 RepID=UPI001118718D|nr:ZIP family metal transporter [Raoultibacter phocaeensis]
MDPFLFITIVTLLAGMGGTGLGGIVGALFRTDSSRTVSLLLSFAGGVMLSIVCFDLLSESIESAQLVSDHAVFIVCGAVIAGVAVVYLLNLLIDRKTNPEVPHVSRRDHPKTHDDLDELIHADHFAEHRKHNDSKSSLFVAGIVMACAIALHNVPEGMTIGAGFATQNELAAGAGIVLAVLIGLHNIPEGMAVAVPLINGGMGRVRAVLVTAASGIPTVVGAWFGFWVGDIGPMGLTLSLGFASGAMLYVVFGEIIPQAILMYRSKLPAFFVIIGILLGLLIIFG